MDQKQMAKIELEFLRSIGALPLGEGDLVLEDHSSPVFDLAGELLYSRCVLYRQGREIGYVDVSALQELGSALLAVNLARPWNGTNVLEAARAKAGELGVTYDDARLVAFQYPKIAVQFNSGGEEVLLLEWDSLRIVEKPRTNRFGEFIEDERRPFLARIPMWARARNRERYGQLHALFQLASGVSAEEKISTFNLIAWELRVLSYGLRTPSHGCFERRRQERTEWCVPACVQMLLDFYRFEYDQGEIACGLKQGTFGSPTRMPCTEQEFEVVRTIERLSCDGLQVDMNSCPFSFWNEIYDQIRANRPLILFSGGHSRIVSGFSLTGPIGMGMFLRKLVLRDPAEEKEVVYEDYDATVGVYSELYQARLLKVQEREECSGGAKTTRQVAIIEGNS